MEQQVIHYKFCVGGDEKSIQAIKWMFASISMELYKRNSVNVVQAKDRLPTASM